MKAHPPTTGESIPYPLLSAGTWSKDCPNRTEKTEETKETEESNLKEIWKRTNLWLSTLHYSAISFPTCGWLRTVRPSIHDLHSRHSAWSWCYSARWFWSCTSRKPSKLMDMSSAPWMLNHVCVCAVYVFKSLMCIYIYTYDYINIYVGMYMYMHMYMYM